MSSPQPADAKLSSSPTPTVTTVTVSGTIITSTTTTTVTTIVTSTVESVVTRTVVATQTITTTVVTAAAPAPVPAPPLAAEIAQQTLQQVSASSQDLETLRIQLVNELARVRAVVEAWWSKQPHGQLEASVGELPREAEELIQPTMAVYGIERADVARQRYQNYISRINELLQRVMNARSVDELNRLRKDVYALLSDVENLKVDVRSVAQQLVNMYSQIAQGVKDDSVKRVLQQATNVYSYLANTDVDALRRDASLFYMLMDMARDDVYKQIYESRKGSFQALLRILSNTATYSDVEKAFEALALIKQLKDQGLLDEKRVVEQYKYTLLASGVSEAGLLTPLSPALTLMQSIQTLLQMRGGELDKEAMQRLSELESQIERGQEPGKKNLPIQLIADVAALIDPVRYIYGSAFNGVKSLARMLGADENTANSIADKVASGVAGASTTVAGVLIPPLGIAMGLSAVLDTVTDIASRLLSPIDKQLLLSYIQSNWQDLIVDTAIGVASGLAAGYATARLKPLIYNKVADALERLGAKDLANKIRLTVGAPAEGGRGVVEATVREVPEEVSVESTRDPVTGKVTLKITLGGKTEVVSIDVPKELENKFRAYGIVTEQASEVPGGGTQINKALEVAFKLIYKTVKDRDKAWQMFKDFVKRLGLGDDVAIQTLAEATKTDVVGDVRLKIWSNSSTIYDNAKGLCRYVEKGGKAWQIVGANDEASSLIRGIVINDDEASMRMLVSKQAYLYPKTGEGSFLNTVFIEKYMSQDAYLALVEDLKKLFNAVKTHIDVLRQIREHPEGGGVPRVAQLLGVEFKPETMSILRSDPALMSYIESALMSMLRGVDVYPIIVYNPSTSFVRASLLIPAAVASTALQSIVERGLTPTNLRIVPINRLVVERAVATRTIETVFNITRTIFTNVVETVPMAEKPIHRTETAPYVVTRTVETVARVMRVVPTSIVDTQTLVEKPIHRTETAPYVVTRIVETVAPAILTQPTAITMTKSLAEVPIHRAETVPVVSTRAVEVVAPQIVTQPTALTRIQQLTERAIHRTETVPVVATQSTTFVVVTTTTVIATVSETGTVSVVTIPIVITYTITVPITIATATPAPPPTTPTVIETGTETVVAKPPLPRLPSVEGAGLVPAPAKPEQKPKLEKEVLVI